MFFLSCDMIPGVDLAPLRVSQAKDFGFWRVYNK